LVVDDRDAEHIYLHGLPGYLAALKTDRSAPWFTGRVTFPSAYDVPRSGTSGAFDRSGDNVGGGFPHRVDPWMVTADEVAPLLREPAGGGSRLNKQQIGVA
jgi:hypothetical protein